MSHAVSYAASFGEQWNRYRQTQLDRFTGTAVSRDRLFQGTGWNPEELRDQVILEVGCGAGRFTQLLLEAGAQVYAIDASTAVKACWMNCGPHPRLRVIQSDLHAMPFRAQMFDRVLCYGVLQHTPDPKRAFMSLLPLLKPGGRIAIDIYRKFPGWRTHRWWAKHMWRPVTKRIPIKVLVRLVEWYVPWWLPIHTEVCARAPWLARILGAVVPCANYTGMFPLTPQQLQKWAILDTVDALSAWHDHPATLQEVQTWFEEVGYSKIDVRYGGNGIVGNAVR